MRIMLMQECGPGQFSMWDAVETRSEAHQQQRHSFKNSTSNNVSHAPPTPFALFG